MLILISLFFAVLVSSSSYAEIRVDDWWIKIGRYEKTLFGGYQSQINQGDYFITPDGATNPLGELEGTLKAFRAPHQGSDDTHPLCIFPARRLYFERIYNERFSFDQRRCKELTLFFNKINLDEVYLIFSSYFIDQPSSAFGHTLLRLKNKKSGKSENDLLDYGVNYSAKVDTLNPILYGVKGIFGGFDGYFSMLPYFFKIREYNDLESRDLWNYHLNLSEDEKSFLLAHLWELEQARFTYWYFTQNCSYHLIKLLDAINPTRNLVGELSGFIVPATTVKVLFSEKGLVRKVSLRPSKFTELNKKVSMLSDRESDSFLESLALDSKLPNNLTPSENIKVLDTLATYIDYTYSEEILFKKGKDFQKVNSRKMQLLLARSKISEKSKPVTYVQEEEDSPDKGHGTRMLTLGGRWINDNRAIEFRFRPTLHSILDNSVGYNPYTTLSMGDFHSSYNIDTKKFSLDYYSIASVMALRPINKIEQKLSWNFDFGVKNIPETIDRELAPFLNVGVGPGFLGKSFISALFIQSEQYYLYNLHHQYRLDLGLKAMMLFKFSNEFNLYTEYNYYKVITDQFDWVKKLNLSLRWNPGSLAFEMGYERELGEDIFMGRVHFYYY